MYKLRNLIIYVFVAIAILTNIPPSVTSAEQVQDRPIISRFDVAAISRTPPDSLSWKMSFTPDGFIAKGVTLRMLLQEAYDAYEDGSVSGGPKWMDNERFDVNAKLSPEEVPQFTSLDLKARRVILQSLLAERFHLQAHYEERQTQVYELIRATPEVKIKETSADRIPASTNMSGLVKTSRPGQLVAEWETMEGFARLLSFQLGRPVVDKTGLDKRYDIQLMWAPDLSDGSIKESDSPDAALPSLFTALKEQLGLTLKATKGSKHVLVVDHVDLPTEN